MNEFHRETLVELRQFGRKGSIAPLDMVIAKGRLWDWRDSSARGELKSPDCFLAWTRADTGQMLVAGRKVSFNSPRQAIREASPSLPKTARSKALFRTLRGKISSWRSRPAREPRERFRRARQLEIAEEFYPSCSSARPVREQAVMNLTVQPTKSAVWPMAGQRNRNC